MCWIVCLNILCVCVCVYVCMCICMYSVCVYIYMYVYIYIYTHTHTHTQNIQTHNTTQTILSIIFKHIIQHNSVCVWIFCVYIYIYNIQTNTELCWITCLNIIYIYIMYMYVHTIQYVFECSIYIHIYIHTIFKHILNCAELHVWILCKYIYIYIYILHAYTGCPRRNVPDFGRVFLMLKYTNITQNTYVQSWTVTEIMAREVWNFDSCYTLIDYQIHIKTVRNMWFL